MDIYLKASQLLKIRPHYSVELSRKLLLRGFERADIEKVINRLLDEGLMNDEEYAEMYLSELIRNKTFGFYGLKAKMMQRGIPSNIAEELLKRNLSPELEKQIAQRAVDRAGEIDKNKLAQKLSRKGFRSEAIRALIKY